MLPFALLADDERTWKGVDMQAARFVAATVMALALFGCQSDPIIVLDDVVTLTILGQENWDVSVGSGDTLTVESDASERISTHLESPSSGIVSGSDRSGVKRVRYTTGSLSGGAYTLVVTNDFDVINTILHPLESLLGSNDVAVVVWLQS